jgi:putative spermidine/putrescine transport system substrate-binding protein
MIVVLAACSSQPGSSTQPTQGPVGTAAGSPAGSPSSTYAVGPNEGTVLISDGGGTYHDSLIKTTYQPCEQQTGIKVESTQYDYSLGAIKAQVAGAKEWDVVTFGTFADDKTASDLFLPLDYNVINTPGLADNTKKKYFLEYVYAGVVVGYRTDKYPASDPPTGWASVWDTAKYAGPRQFLNDPVDPLTAALLADGVTKDQLYPIDVERGLKKLDALLQKGEIKWFSSGQEMIQDLTSGIATIGEAWNARTLKAASEGAPLAYQTKQTILLPTAWTVLKTAPHPKAAMEFIKCAVQAERQAADAVDFLGNIPGNPLAFDLLSADVKASMPTPDDTVVADSAYWGQNYTTVLARWQDWFASKQ